MVLKGVMDKKPTKNRRWKICQFKPTLKFNLFWDWYFSTFFLIIWFKSTKMKLRPHFTMELVQKLMKKNWKYLIYSPLTENILTECPCMILSLIQSKIWFRFTLIGMNRGICYRGKPDVYINFLRSEVSTWIKNVMPAKPYDEKSICSTYSEWTQILSHCTFN